MNIQSGRITEHASLYICIYLGVLFLVGCTKEPPASSSLKDRLQAAKLITVSSEKNAALEKVAADAAKQGDGEIAHQAIIEISQSEIRNSAAADTATLLAKSGKVKEAVKVAELINQTDIRNKVLAEIAKQE